MITPIIGKIDRYSWDEDDTCVICGKPLLEHDEADWALDSKVNGGLAADDCIMSLITDRTSRRDIIDYMMKDDRDTVIYDWWLGLSSGYMDFPVTLHNKLTALFWKEYAEAEETEELGFVSNFFLVLDECIKEWASYASDDIWQEIEFKEVR